MRISPWLLAPLALPAIVACSRSSSSEAAPTATTAAPIRTTATDVGTVAMTATAPPTTTSLAGPGGSAAGPTVSIPAGALIEGTPCGEQPRAPGEELSGESMALTAFDIDAYPYPNDPAQPPRTGVTRDEASKLCAARGRRLCTEVEWERACKGPKNFRYEYGNRFDPKVCPTGLGAIASLGGSPECVSGFGVHAMHGYVWEWTASDWKRGKDEGKVVERGGHGNQPYAHMRCSNARAAVASKGEASVGFRCCGGPANTAEVVIPADDPAPAALVEESLSEEGLTARLKRALVNGSFKDPEGTTSTFTRIWRWHPAPKDEFILVRYESKASDGTRTVQPLVVRLCKDSVQLIGRLRGAVETMDNPVVKEDTPGTAVIKVGGGGSSDDVKLTYQYGQLTIAQPAWLKESKAPK